MGCGSQRPNNTVIISKSKSDAKSDAKIEDKSTSIKSKFSTTSTGKKKKVNSVYEITVSPGQFILEKNESVYKNYELKEKMGEGKHFIICRIIWGSL